MAARKYYLSAAILAAALILTGSECASVDRRPAGAENIYESAMSDLKKQRLEEATFNFRRVFEQYPSSNLADDALYRLAYISCIKRNYASATGLFEILLGDYPKSEWTFDAEVWHNLLLDRQSLYNRLENANTKLGTVARASSERVVEDVPEGNESMSGELDRLREENRQLRELIESME